MRRICFHIKVGHDPHSDRISFISFISFSQHVQQRCFLIQYRVVQSGRLIHHGHSSSSAPISSEFQFDANFRLIIFPPQRYDIENHGARPNRGASPPRGIRRVFGYLHSGGKFIQIHSNATGNFNYMP